MEVVRMRDWQNSIQTGDCFDVLDELPAESVHMCMTSPPYYGLRDYSHEDQIGLEETLDEYIDRLVRVGDALRRVLRDDGSWWLNLGDSYAGSGGAGGQWTAESSGSAEYAGDRGDGYNGPLNEQLLRRKNKMLVPHRVAIALQESGWVVRNDVTWVKPNPMPSSVKDRLNTTTEQIFHLTPQPDYWYDLDAIREPYAESYEKRADKGYEHKHGDAADGWADGDHGHAANHNVGGILDESGEYGDHMHPSGKNPGDVFEVSTKPFPDAHFAVYPPELCEKPIKATCPPKVCADCGAPYQREVEDNGLAGEAKIQEGERPAAEERGVSDTSLLRTNARTWRDRKHVGWNPTCDCDTDATEPGICLDPFAGAGTTCLKAKELGRRFVGIELNPEYADMARARVGLTPEDPARVRDDDDQQGLEAFADGGGSDA